MRPVGVRVGPVKVWLWSGSWTLVDREPCEGCHNLYVGPFGVEWGRH